MKSLVLLLAFEITSLSLAQNVAEKIVEVDSVSVSGTRLPSDSLIRLSGINVHDKVNDQKVSQACHKITATGLVKTVDYAYDAYPDRPGVVLNLTVADEGPLLPASIKPVADEKTLWSCLAARDPIFTSQLPPTEKALAFYANNMEACLKGAGRMNEYAAPNVIADAGGKLTGIVFEIRTYRKEH